MLNQHNDPSVSKLALFKQKLYKYRYQVGIGAFCVVAVILIIAFAASTPKYTPSNNSSKASSTMVFEVAADPTTFDSSSNKQKFLEEVTFLAEVSADSMQVSDVKTSNDHPFVFIKFFADDNAGLDKIRDKVQGSWQGGFKEFNVVKYFPTETDLAIQVPGLIDLQPTPDPGTTVAPTDAPTDAPTSGPTQAPTTAVPTPTTGAVAININCGGLVDYTDSKSVVWKADNSFVGGIAYKSKVVLQGDPLLLDERNFMMISATDGYSIKVPNGKYLVKLYFAEVYFAAPGARLFKVLVEGTNPYTLNGGVMDPFAAAGGQGVAYVVETQTTVADGAIDIGFVKVKQNPNLNAIEIRSLA